MIEWDEEGLDRLLAQGIEGPIDMLNLLRFRPDGGEEKYFSYLTETNFARDEYGAELIYWGRGGDPLVMEDCGKKWDAAGFVRYPSVQTFVDMVRDPRFQAREHLRHEALVDSVLQPTFALGDGRN
jgi:uncharacterized protein (DUF1330 family)